MSATCASQRFLSAKISLFVETLCVSLSEKVGGYILGCDGLCFWIFVSVWAGGCIGVMWVIGLMWFAARIVVAIVGVDVRQRGRGEPLSVLCFGLLLPLTTWDCWRLMVGARNHAPYCWSSVLTVALLSVQSGQSFSSWLRMSHP